jgi:hypothetical protein
VDTFLRGTRALVQSHPAFVATIIVLLTLAFGRLSMDAATETGTSNFAPDNDAYRASTTIDDEFETDSSVTAQVALVAPEGGDVLSPEGVAAVEELRGAILADERIGPALVRGGEMPPVLTFADPILGAAVDQGVDLAGMDGDTFDRFVDNVLAELPLQQAQTVTGLLGGDVEGADAPAGMLMVFLDGSEATSEDVRDEAFLAFAELRGLAEGYEVHPFNEVLLFEEVNEAITAEMGTLLGIAFLLIILILVGIYRRASDVIASLLGLVFSIAWMQGIAVILGPGLLGWIGGQSEMSLMIPILLVGLGVDYGIHLTMRHREQRIAGDAPTAAAGGAITAVGTALILATLTTVVGFMTNVTNPLPPLRDFGVNAAVGVTSAFLIMTTFVPSVRLLFDRLAERRGRLRQVPGSRTGRPSLLGRAAAAFAPVAVRHPGRVVTGALVLTALGAVGSTQLSTEFGQTDFFPEDSKALATVNTMDEHFGGDLAEQTSILVEGDVATVDAWNALGALHAGLADDEGVRTVDGEAQAQSILTVLVSAGFADPPPTTDAEVAELYDTALAEVPGAAGYVSREGGASHDALVVHVGTQVADQVEGLQEDLAADTAALEAAGLEVTVTSNGILNDTVLTELRDSQLTSLILTLVASMTILALAFWVRNRRPVLGVLSIATVAMVVFWVFGIMAGVGIPFNVMTAMISALAIGIGVPFGIHVVNRYLEDHRREPDVEAAMRSTLENTGGALMGSALTTVAGFGVLMLGSMAPMRQFGFVTALTIALAMAASILVLPAMLALWSRREDRRTPPSSIGEDWARDEEARELVLAG